MSWVLKKQSPNKPQVLKPINLDRAKFKPLCEVDQIASFYMI